MAKSAWEEAQSLLGNAGQKLNSGFKGLVQNLAQDYQNYAQQKQQEALASRARMQNFVKNPIDYFRPESNSGQNNFWTSPTAEVLAGQRNILPKFTFAEDVSNKMPENNGWQKAGKIATSVALGIPESILNTPNYLTQGWINTGAAIGDRQPLPKILAKAAEPAEGLLNVATLGGASLFTQGGKQTLKEALKRVVPEGVKYGLGYGTLAGIQANKDAPDVGQQLLNTIPYTVTGGLAGAAMAALGTGGSYVLDKALTKYVSPALKRFFTSTQEQGGVITPADFKANAIKIGKGNKTFVAWATEIADQAEKAGQYISLDITSTRPKSLGKIAGYKPEDNFVVKFIPVLKEEAKNVTQDIVPQTISNILPAVEKTVPIVPEVPTLPPPQNSVTAEIGLNNEWLHGSPQQFETFDVNKSAPSNIYGKAQYLTQDEVVAKRYAKENGNISKVGLEGKNIFDASKKLSDKEIDDIVYKLPIDKATADELALHTKHGSSPNTLDTIKDGLRIRTPSVGPGVNEVAGDMIQQALKELGYDGVKFTHMQKDGPVIALFDRGLEPSPEKKILENILPSESQATISETIAALDKFRGYNSVDISPAKTDEELAMQALNNYRGYEPLPPETISQLKPEAQTQIHELQKMGSEFTTEANKVDDVLKNYNFYNKRFGKLMNRTELKLLKIDLGKSIKEIDKQIKQLSTQTEQVPVPDLTNDELAMKSLEKSRKALEDIQTPTESAPSANVVQPQLVSSVPDTLPTDLEAEKILAKTKVEPSPEVHADIAKAAEAKAKVEGIEPAVYTEDMQKKFDQAFATLIGSHNVALTTATQVSEPFARIPVKYGLDIIRARENGGSTNAVINDWVQKIGAEYDKLYQNAVDSGVDMGYLNDYITHIWEQAPEEVLQAYKTAKTKFAFSGKRKVPTYEEGIQMGLTPKYTHPAQIIANYVRKLEEAKANVAFFNTMKNEGIIVTSKQGQQLPGYVPVTAPGINQPYIGHYYAPAPVAKILNNVFSPAPDTGVNRALDIGAKIAGGVQEVRLAGGIPFTPINAFVVDNAIKEMITGAAGLWNSPIVSVQQMGNPVISIVESMVPGVAKNIFRKNAEKIKQYQLRGYDFKTAWNIDDLIEKPLIDKVFDGGLKKTFFRAINDATFKKWIPLVRLNLLNSVEAGAIRSGKSETEAMDIAAEAVGRFEGLIKTWDLAKREKALNDAITIGLMAPKWRESMVWTFANALKASSPIHYSKAEGVHLNNPLSAKNRLAFNFLTGAVALYVVMDMINYAYQGRHMSQNPSGTEDKALITRPDGTVIGIPFLPGIATLPRMGYRVVKDLIKGDVGGAGTDVLQTGGSIFLAGIGDVVANADHWGNPIYDDNDNAVTRYKKIGAYLANRFNYPWVDAAIKVAINNAKPEDQKRPTYQIISEAAEVPLRYYTVNKINSKFYYDALSQARATLNPQEQKVWDDIYKSGIKLDPEDGLPVFDTREKMADAMNRMAFPNILAAETKAMRELSQKTGQPLNPFYNLSPEQQMVVLWTKALPPADGYSKQLRKENSDWMPAYYNANSEYVAKMKSLGIFSSLSTEEQQRQDAIQSVWASGITNAQQIADTLNQTNVKSGETGGRWTADGVNKYLTSKNFYNQPSKELQAKLDYYNTLPNGTGARSRFLRANPDVLAYFQQQSEATGAKLKELGLPVLDNGWSSFGQSSSSPKVKVGSVPKIPMAKFKGATRRAAATIKLKPLSSTAKVKTAPPSGRRNMASFKIKPVTAKFNTKISA